MVQFLFSDFLFLILSRLKPPLSLAGLHNVLDICQCFVSKSLSLRPLPNFLFKSLDLEPHFFQHELHT